MKVRIEPTFGSAVGEAVQRTDTASDGLSEKDALAIVVGDRFSTYLHHWRLYEASGRAPRRWNWPAFLFSSLWFFFRRMHAWGTIWFILSPLLMTTFALLGLPWLSSLSFVVFAYLQESWRIRCTCRIAEGLSVRLMPSIAGHIGGTLSCRRLVVSATPLW